MNRADFINRVSQHIGHAFRLIRMVHYPLRLEDVGSEVGVSLAQISNIELGKSVSVETFLRLCVLYQVNPGDVLPELDKLTEWVDEENEHTGDA